MNRPSAEASKPRSNAGRATWSESKSEFQSPCSLRSHHRTPPFRASGCWTPQPKRLSIHSSRESSKEVQENSLAVVVQRIRQPPLAIPNTLRNFAAHSVNARVSSDVQIQVSKVYKVANRTRNKRGKCVARSKCTFLEVKVSQESRKNRLKSV